MTRLSVNVNKIATLRNARGGNVPDVLQTTLAIERFGAQGITVHPRPDERHILKDDVRAIKKHIRVELNVEGYPSSDYLDLVREVQPAQCTLVPDPPDVLTSNAGWKVQEQQRFLTKIIAEIKSSTDARVSLFIDPMDYADLDFSAITACGADSIELYTELYAQTFDSPKHKEVLELYQRVGLAAHQAGLGVNAGHDLNLTNLARLISAVGVIDEVSIGHALISDALFLGLELTIQRYLACLKQP